MISLNKHPHNTPRTTIIIGFENNDSIPRTVISTINHFRNYNQRKTSVSFIDSYHLLGSIDLNGNESKRRTRKGQYWKSDSVSSITWCINIDGYQKHWLQRCGRPNNTLCASTIFVRFNKFRQHFGSCHYFRFPQTDGIRRNGGIQQSYSSKSRRLWFNRHYRNDERYYSPRSDDSIPKRSGADGEVYRNFKKECFKAWREVSRSQGEAQRKAGRSKSFGTKFSSFCQNKGRKKESWKKTLSCNKRNPRADKQLIGNWSQTFKQSWQRSNKAQRCYENIIPTNTLFSRNWLCSKQKNHSFTNERTLRHSSWQSWKKCRIWFEMGNQQDCWWFHSRVLDGWYGKSFRQEICHRFFKKTRRNIWCYSKNFWLRPRSIQSSKYKESKKNGCPECWDCSQGSRRMGYSGRKFVRPYKARAGPSRRLHWNNQTQKVWIQQTECKKCIGNGGLWSSSYIGIQLEQVDKNISREFIKREKLVDKEIENKIKWKSRVEVDRDIKKH